MKTNNIYFAWLDFETGGLNGRLDNGHLGMDYYPIFEVALIVTDSQLNQVGESLRLVINQSEERIAESSEWAVDTHTKSGLLDEVRSSKLSLKDAEHAIISHLQTLGIDSYDRKKKSGAILAGSSIMFDRTFMMCQMPELSDYLHYRQLDVSAFNLAVRAFRPEIEDKVQKQYKHEALADIQETIDEFKVYRDALFGNAKYQNFRWKFDSVENAEFIEIRDWFLSAREISPGLITLILTKGGFEQQHRSTIVKTEDFKVKALEWAVSLLDHYQSESAGKNSVKTKIYIAGPMSGLPEFNRPSFHLADTLLTKAGKVVLNPAMLPDGLSQPEYMDICCAMVRCADALFMLNDWERSEGAVAEYHLAKKLGKSIIFQNETEIPEAEGRYCRQPKQIMVKVCQVYGASHNYQSSIDGGTMVCECGAWK